MSPSVFIEKIVLNSFHKPKARLELYNVTRTLLSGDRQTRPSHTFYLLSAPSSWYCQISGCFLPFWGRTYIKNNSIKPTEVLSPPQKKIWKKKPSVFVFWVCDTSTAISKPTYLYCGFKAAQDNHPVYCRLSPSLPTTHYVKCYPCQQGCPFFCPEKEGASHIMLHLGSIFLVSSQCPQVSAIN